MDISRRKFISSSIVGSGIVLAGCAGDSEDLPTEEEPIDGDVTDEEYFVWSNGNASVEAGVSSELEGDEFEIEFVVAQFVDAVWVVIDEPENGLSLLRETEVPVGPLDEYGAVDGGVLYNDDSGGVGERIVIDCSVSDTVVVSVYGAMLDGERVSSVDVLNVYRI